MRHNQEQQQWIPEVSLSPSMARFLPYRGQYVAVQGERLIAHSKLAEVLREAKASGKPFTIHAIPKELGKLRILPIRIRSLEFHASDESQVAHVSPLGESPRQAQRDPPSRAWELGDIPTTGSGF